MPSLVGVKVVDLSKLLPGPYATLVMADMGAEVVKVENPVGGDEMRSFPPFLPDGRGALYEALNRNKKIVSVDLKDPAGFLHFLELLKDADVLVESFRPGVMKRLGADFESLHKPFPQLIYCSISGYGQTGPDAQRAGHDINYLARSGVLGLGGAPNGLPALPGAQMADVGGSWIAVSGILAALFERHSTGVGQHLDVSMTEAALSFAHMHMAAAGLMGGKGTAKRGEELLNGGLANYQVYATSDGRHLAVGSLEPRFFQTLSKVLGLQVSDDDALNCGTSRSLELKKQIGDILIQKTLNEWGEVFSKVDACVEPVMNFEEVFLDPQLHHRKSIEETNGIFVLKTPLRHR